MADDTTESTDENVDIKQLRESHKRLPQLEQEAAEAAQLRREMAFIKAGIDTESRQGQLLMKAYDGELTADAIRAEAEALGFTTPAAETPAAPEVELAPGEGESMSTLANLEPGATPDPDGPKTDPREQARTDYKRAMDAGAKEEEALGKAFHTLVQAAHKGDQRVIVDPFSPQALGSR